MATRFILKLDMVWVAEYVDQHSVGHVKSRNTIKWSIYLHMVIQVCQRMLMPHLYLLIPLFVSPVYDPLASHVNRHDSLCPWALFILYQRC